MQSYRVSSELLGCLLGPERLTLSSSPTIFTHLAPPHPIVNNKALDQWLVPSFQCLVRGVGRKGWASNPSHASPLRVPCRYALPLHARCCQNVCRTSQYCGLHDNNGPQQHPLRRRSTALTLRPSSTITSPSRVQHFHPLASSGIRRAREPKAHTLTSRDPGLASDHPVLTTPLFPGSKGSLPARSIAET